MIKFILLLILIVILYYFLKNSKNKKESFQDNTNESDESEIYLDNNVLVNSNLYYGLENNDKDNLSQFDDGKNNMYTKDLEVEKFCLEGICISKNNETDAKRYNNILRKNNLDNFKFLNNKNEEVKYNFENEESEINFPSKLCFYKKKKSDVPNFLRKISNFLRGKPIYDNNDNNNNEGNINFDIDGNLITNANSNENEDIEESCINRTHLQMINGERAVNLKDFDKTKINDLLSEKSANYNDEHVISPFNIDFGVNGLGMEGVKTHTFYLKDDGKDIHNCDLDIKLKGGSLKNSELPVFNEDDSEPIKKEFQPNDIIVNNNGNVISESKILNYTKRPSNVNGKNLLGESCKKDHNSENLKCGEWTRPGWGTQPKYYKPDDSGYVANIEYNDIKNYPNLMLIHVRQPPNLSTGSRVLIDKDGDEPKILSSNIILSFFAFNEKVIDKMKAYYVFSRKKKGTELDYLTNDAGKNELEGNNELMNDYELKLTFWAFDKEFYRNTTNNKLPFENTIPIYSYKHDSPLRSFIHLRPDYGNNWTLDFEFRAYSAYIMQDNTYASYGGPACDRDEGYELVSEEECENAAYSIRNNYYGIKKAYPHFKVNWKWSAGGPSHCSMRTVNKDGIFHSIFNTSAGENNGSYAPICKKLRRSPTKVNNYRPNCISGNSDKTSHSCKRNNIVKVGTNNAVSGANFIIKPAKHEVNDELIHFGKHEH